MGLCVQFGTVTHFGHHPALVWSVFKLRRVGIRQAYWKLFDTKTDDRSRNSGKALMVSAVGRTFETHSPVIPHSRLGLRVRPLLPIYWGLTIKYKK